MNDETDVEELRTLAEAAVADWKIYIGPPYIGGREYASRLNVHMGKMAALLGAGDASAANPDAGVPWVCRANLDSPCSARDRRHGSACGPMVES